MSNIVATRGVSRIVVLRFEPEQVSTANTEVSAIVLGGNVNGLGVLRSLGRMGVPCGQLYVYDETDYSRCSRYVQRAEAVGKDDSDAKLRAALDRIANALGGLNPVLIPTADRFSQFLVAQQSTLAEHYRFNCAMQDLVDAFLDKWKTAKICQENGIRIPLTICPMSQVELEVNIASLHFPVIIKPRYTFSGNFPGKNAVAASQVELMEFFAVNNIFGDAVVQEIIPSGDGDVLAIASYSDSKGRVLASVCWRKLRQYRPDYGATCFGITESHPELEQNNRAFLEGIRYRGFSMSEYAQSRRDSLPYFLELNTRTAWPNQMFVDAGVDLTQLAFLDMIGHERAQTAKKVQRDGTVWLDYRRDRASMRIKKQRGEISLLQWLLSLAKARSFAHWNWRDPLPFVLVCLWRVWRRLPKFKS